MPLGRRKVRYCRECRKGIQAFFHIKDLKEACFRIKDSKTPPMKQKKNFLAHLLEFRNFEFSIVLDQRSPKLDAKGCVKKNLTFFFSLLLITE